MTTEQETPETVEEEEAPEVEEEGTGTVGVSPDVQALNERLGYPITGEGEPTEGVADAEPEVEGSSDDDSAEGGEATEARYTTGSKSVADVQADVEAGTVSAADALEAENSLSNPRPTLVAWLQDHNV